MKGLLFQVIFIFVVCGMAYADPEPDLFVVESVRFSPTRISKNGSLTTTAIVSLLEPELKGCEYRECWGNLVWPTGVSAYMGEVSCTIERVDALTLQVVLRDELSTKHPRGYYRFESLSMRSSCKDYSIGYEGPRSRFKLE